MTNVERAAGGLVVRKTAAGPQVLLIDDAYGRVSFPKGHLEAGETWESAAIREIQEETGISARILAPLGRVEYKIERDGQPVRKQVRLFLLAALDESVEPTPQQEELDGAYFLPWNEAASRHEERGYDNWKWIFAKAALLWQWHDADWEEMWRHLDAATQLDVFERQWPTMNGWLDQLVSSVEDELAATAPDIAAAWRSVRASSSAIALPRTLADEAEVLRGAIEHTLLKPEASEVDVVNLCREAVAHRFRAVCVNPQHAAVANQVLAGSDVILCTVVGFPLGAVDVDALVAETEAVIRHGAREVDMVIPIGSMREDDIWRVEQAVSAVVRVAHAYPNVRVKAILEAHFLRIDQLVKASIVALAAGADFIKTSTGFAASGARLADVACMAKIAGEHRGVKAAGGIRSRLAARSLLGFGATRIGTSSGPALSRE